MDFNATDITDVIFGVRIISVDDCMGMNFTVSWRKALDICEVNCVMRSTSNPRRGLMISMGGTGYVAAVTPIPSSIVLVLADIPANAALMSCPSWSGREMDSDCVSLSNSSMISWASLRGGVAT